MKEFIEKLIGRLEEKSNQTWLVLAERNGYERAIEIVNQLAEEYINCSTDTSSGWIPCSERLPDTYDNLLICQSDGYVNVGWYSLNEFKDMDSIPYKDVIAWQPLPPGYVPKEGRE